VNTSVTNIPNVELKDYDWPFSACLFIDAGIEEIRFLQLSASKAPQQWSIPSSSGISAISTDLVPKETPIYICGKMQKLINKHFRRGECFSSVAVLWSAAAARVQNSTIAILDLSASGYMLVGVDGNGKLKDNLLVTNSKCGAGAGINLDRVLRKLSIERRDVDDLLNKYLGESGRQARFEIPTRADRCGVFASSATISDKNQGLPLDFALATTLKSEVLKACKFIKTYFDRVILTGGVFAWQFARDCAKDYFDKQGIRSVEHDQSRSLLFQGMQRLSLLQKVPSTNQNFRAEGQKSSYAKSLPSFTQQLKRLSAQKLYNRQIKETCLPADSSSLQKQPLLIGIDVGSTMAKILVCEAESQTPLHQASYSNAGDTVETLKAMLADLQKLKINSPAVSQIGVTGSARYQIQQAIVAVYPELTNRVMVLVENYAHARGSAALAVNYLNELEDQGIDNLNKDLCFLVDVGGEDTKISSIDLHRGDLYDNAMNTKCSAGTGSLLDTLVDLFSLQDINTAAEKAMQATNAHALNATCAVFLLEHARQLQAEGLSEDDILASAVWSVAENMARSLWPQISMTAGSLFLLHGQTMQSDPLPLAITERLQSYLGGPAYCLVPPDPGFRACMGLIQTMAEHPRRESVNIPLELFIEQPFNRSILKCHGAICGDINSCCYRSKLTALNAEGKNFSFSLGGCSAINERKEKQSKTGVSVRNSCKDIWQYQIDHLPVSNDTNRLIIPRSFAVSEWARFFASLFEPLAIPVHVDTPTEDDILMGQSQFRVDTCAPHIGVVGQFLRLAEQAHGVILAPQIEFLPTSSKSLSRTCTVNQGGFAVARGLAIAKFPRCNIELFDLNLKITEPDLLAHKLFLKLLPVYKHYQIDISFEMFLPLVEAAMKDQLMFRKSVADYAAELALEALDKNYGIAVVLAREYILNPGVYDSHVGRLLQDKGLVGIPSYVFDVELNSGFTHLYWRNSHTIATVTEAVARKSLHKILNPSALQKIISVYEQREQLLPLIQVSTFLCGPDSVTNPMVSELIKNRPFLRIQSDAAIKELAHLENRMNTYVRQLAANNIQSISCHGSSPFEVELLDLFTNREPLNPKTDVICFPTLSDNRGLLAVIRSAGFCCLENYTDSYSLQALVEQGRNVAGDSVCAPLAAVYGDILRAISQFQRLRQSDPVFRGKNRLLIFNNKGLGPCRQGQYVEAHKLFLQQTIIPQHKDRDTNDQMIQFLVGIENEGFNTGFPGWVFLRGIQATILQGVLHQLLAEGSAHCRTPDCYRKFYEAYIVLKEELIAAIETFSAPRPEAMKLSKRMRLFPGIYQLITWFSWGLYKSHLAAPLRTFRNKWCDDKLPFSQIRIHIDGEAYMRTAQFEALHEGILEILGPGRFHLSYTPLWSFLEYKLAGMLMRANEGIEESRAEIKRGGSSDFISKRRLFLRQKQKRWMKTKAVHFFLRRVLAAPLYNAAGIQMPEPMPKVLEIAKEVISTRRPGGELVPYVGEAMLKLQKGYDLVLNIAPEGCMVSSMGEAITPAIHDAFPHAQGRIYPLFSQQGDVDLEKLDQALLQALGPEKLYSGE
jgi:activator of 2-hydroxyglutaryl-CoA dehydratase/predicted nucleotide-binding protein (sugar kinase/HSP70/actin superfamily)